MAKFPLCVRVCVHGWVSEWNGKMQSRCEYMRIEFSGKSQAIEQAPTYYEKGLKFVQ